MKKTSSKNWSMADISGKETTHRVAIAGGRIRIGREAFRLLSDGKLPKGDPLAMAEIAGIQAAKQTPSLIPLCHPISLKEALTGLSIALLTIWDLTKPVNAALEITNSRLIYKSGGKSGVWVNPDGMPDEVVEIIAEMG